MTETMCPHCAGAGWLRDPDGPIGATLRCSCNPEREAVPAKPTKAPVDLTEARATRRGRGYADRLDS